MTAKEVRRLRRRDLLEMLLDVSKENEQLRIQVAMLQKKLEDRTIEIQNAGSLAEAALQLNGFFQAAEASCEQYIENIRQRSEHLEENCRKMEQQTREKCQAMIAQAEVQAQNILNEAEKKIKEQYGSYSWLSELMENTNGQVNYEE